ncbi:MAG: biotin/lipoyl-binding protein [Phycisphaerales bacterium]
MRLRVIVLPLLALAGVAAAAYTVRVQNKPAVAPPPVVPPVSSPYPYRVAGSGVVEPASEVVRLSAVVPGVVQQVHVKEGEVVKTGAPLFTVDSRDVASRLAAAEARLQVTRMKLAQLDSLPRPEKVREAEAIVEQRRWAVDDARKRLERLDAVGTDDALSRNERPTREFELAAAKARLEEAEASLATVKRGTYPEDRAVAQADVGVAEAEVAQLRTDLDRATVKAPIDGAVLRVNVRPGEFATAGPSQDGLVVMGSEAPLNIRVDVDELDGWRFDPRGRAVAALRGGKRQEFPIEFVRVVPLVMPKKTLTGENSERIDTRVLQVIYRFSQKDVPVYPGQLLDVYIETREPAMKTADLDGAAR